MLGMIWTIAMSVSAQVAPWDDVPTPPRASAATRHALTLNDLKDSIRAYSNGETGDNSLRNGLVIMMAVLAVLALLLHLRQRYKTAGPKDSLGSLAWELAWQTHFPFGSRVVLWWVARSTGSPYVSLMLSSSLYDKSVAEWANQPTFGLIRKWGRGRLERLRGVLFG